MKKQLVTGKKILLFIDTGDNCRCPLAKGYLSRLLAQRNIDYIDIRTAGVMTPTGLLPTPEVVQLLAEDGIDIRRHRSRPLTLDLINSADLILGMTPIHVQKAIRMTEDARGKTFLLKEYVGSTGKNIQIPDPMGGTLEIFKKCYSDVRQCLTRLVELDFIAKPPEPKEVLYVDMRPFAERKKQQEDLEAAKAAEEALVKAAQRQIWEEKRAAAKAKQPKEAPVKKKVAAKPEPKPAKPKAAPTAPKSKPAAPKPKAAKPVAKAAAKPKAAPKKPAAPKPKAAPKPPKKSAPKPAKSGKPAAAKAKKKK